VSVIEGQRVYKCKYRYY